MPMAPKACQGRVRRSTVRGASICPVQCAHGALFGAALSQASISIGKIQANASHAPWHGCMVFRLAYGYQAAALHVLCLGATPPRSPRPVGSWILLSGTGSKTVQIGRMGNGSAGPGPPRAHQWLRGLSWAICSIYRCAVRPRTPCGAHKAHCFWQLLRKLRFGRSEQSGAARASHAPWHGRYGFQAGPWVPGSSPACGMHRCGAASQPPAH